MSRTTFLSSLAAMLFAGTGTTVFAQNDGDDDDHKVRIEITKKENGQTTHITREFDLTDEKQLEDALRELGVMDELKMGDGENLVIDLRHLGAEGGLLRDMSMAFADAGDAAEPRAFLGIYGGNWDPKDCGKDNKSNKTVREGASITDVIAGTPAEKAGLKEGDVITGIDDDKVSSYSQLVELLSAHQPNDEVRVTYFRDGKKSTQKVTLGEQEGEDREMWNYSDDTEAPDSEGMDWEAYYNDGAQSDEARPFFGVVGGEEEGSDVSGVRIGEVVEGSSAAKMGVQEGDIIKQINGEDVGDLSELAGLIGGMSPSDPIEVKLVRKGVDMTLNGTMGQQQRQVWNGAMPPAPSMPGMPPMPPMPDLNGVEMTPEDRAEFQRNMEEYQRDMEEHARDMEEYGRDQNEFRRDMDELRAQMDQLRHELRGGVTREVRVTIGPVELSKEETDMLRNKGVAGLDKKLELPALKCFPNPSGGFFRLEFQVPDRGDLNVDVHDSNGERVYHETITGFKGNYERTLDLSDRANGTYYLVIVQNGQTRTQKLVKQ